MRPKCMPSLLNHERQRFYVKSSPLIWSRRCVPNFHDLILNHEDILLFYFLWLVFMLHLFLVHVKTATLNCVFAHVHFYITRMRIDLPLTC